jgi:hypothetical protein
MRSKEERLASAIQTLGSLRKERSALKRMKSSYGFELDPDEKEKRLLDIYDLTQKIDRQKTLIAILKVEEQFVGSKRGKKDT